MDEVAIEKIDGELAAYLAAARVAHMATVDESGMPTVSPICYFLHRDRLYTPIDEKPKRVPAAQLKRVRNLLAHPSMAVVVDTWSEDWSRLGWVMLRGVGSVLEPASDYPDILVGLRAKYRQYRNMDLETRPLIQMEIRSVRQWGRLTRD